MPYQLGCDLDGVLWDTQQAIVDEFIQRGWAPKDTEADDIVCFDVCHQFGVPMEQYKTIFNGELFTRVKPFESRIQDILSLYQNGVEILFITARTTSSDIQDVTLDSMQAYGFRTSDILFTKSSNKVMVAAPYNLKAFIEDYAPTAIDMTQVVEQSFLIETSYNSLSGSEAMRYNNLRRTDWDSAFEAVKTLLLS